MSSTLPGIGRPPLLDYPPDTETVQITTTVPLSVKRHLAAVAQRKNRHFGTECGEALTRWALDESARATELPR
jgi:hypothetical protein